jgi:hypothetical protein
MRKHLKVGTRVKLVNYNSNYNGMPGFVKRRDGEYYAIKLDGQKYSICDVYLCELEEI